MLFVVGINKALHQCSVFCRNIPRKSVICLIVHHCIFGICLWLRHRPTKVRVTQKSDCSDLACPEITPPPGIFGTFLPVHFIFITHETRDTSSFSLLLSNSLIIECPGEQSDSPCVTPARSDSLLVSPVSLTLSTAAACAQRQWSNLTGMTSSIVMIKIVDRTIFEGTWLWRHKKNLLAIV